MADEVKETNAASVQEKQNVESMPEEQKA